MLAQDLRYALRSLWKDRRATAIVIACLGLGIGINATIFSLIDGVMVKPLPFAAPDQLVMLNETFERGGVTRAWLSYETLRDFKAQQDRLSHIAGIAFRNLAFSDSGAEPERVRGAAISWELFPMLGVAPALGRQFGPEDDRPGAEPVVILSDALWRRRYNADSGIIGRSVTVNARPCTVVGVMPPAFEFPENERAWIPVAPVVSGEPRSARTLYTFGRLKPGVDPAAAQSELAAIASRLSSAHPLTNDGWSVRVSAARDEFIPDDVRLILSTMMGAVTLVLLIACANVANLMLARASVRQREFSVRAALGAGRARMVRQLLTECVILGLAAAPLGIAIAYLGVMLLDRAVPPDDVPYYIGWRVDGRVIAYAAAVSALTGMVFGLAPALQAGRLNLLDSLRDGSRGTGTSGRRARLRSALVVVEVALALVLLVGASLFVRSYLNLQGASAGFDTRPLLTLRVFMTGGPGGPYQEPAQRVQRIEDILRRVEAVPGVESAFASSFVPLDGGGDGGRAAIEGRTFAAGEEPFIGLTPVSSRLYQTMALALVKGRGFSDAEGMSRTPIAIVNETMAARFWPGEDPIGRRFRLISGTAQDWFTIVGVGRDLRRDSFDDDTAAYAEAFVPFPYGPTPNTGFTIRTSIDAASAVSAVRTQIRASDPGLPIFNVQTMEELRRRGFWQFRLFGQMFGIFGGVALLLAAIGVYGVLSFTVSQRTQEIGLRMALGARRPDVLRLVVGHGLGLAAAGIAMGLLGAFAITRVIRTMLYNVTPTDPISFTGVALFLAAMAIAASYVPARRATKVDPIVALREQ